MNCCRMQIVEITPIKPAKRQWSHRSHKFPPFLCNLPLFFSPPFFSRWKKWLARLLQELLIVDVASAFSSPSAPRRTGTISHQAPGSFAYSNTMASALRRCPVFHCLLLLLFCFHCSQGELPWSCTAESSVNVLLVNLSRSHLLFSLWMCWIY